jgi:hypothetical protein
VAKLEHLQADGDESGEALTAEGHASCPGEDRTAIVSSSSSRSAVEISTAAGTPLRVTVTRSWVCSTEATRAENRSRASPTGNVVMATVVAKLSADCDEDLRP